MSKPKISVGDIVIVAHGDTWAAFQVAEASYWFHANFAWRPSAGKWTKSKRGTGGLVENIVARFDTFEDAQPTIDILQSAWDDMNDSVKRARMRLKTAIRLAKNINDEIII